MNVPPLPSMLTALVIGAATVALGGCRADDPTPQKEGAAAAGDLGPTVPPRVAPAPPGPGESWNTAQIEWFDFNSGVARATAENKPILLVVYTTWCPHCKNYSRVFEDPKVVEEVKGFIAIRIDADQDSDVAKRYAKDGSYIPRTFFLQPDGTPDFEVKAARPQYAYFYDERNPASLLAGMASAKQRLAQR
ncbi:MAG: thioredoxin family protein [Polyangiaceae bacterium]